MNVSRPISGLLAGAVALAIGIAPAAAQDYPTRAITVIVPFAAGGPTDVIARIVTDNMSKTLGQTFVIENVVGAGGTTGITRAKRAKNDGYTIAMGHLGTHAAAPSLYPNLQYDPVNDFEPIGLAAGTPILILARKDFPAKDLKEFVGLREGERNQGQRGPCRRRLGVVHHLPAAQQHPEGEADRGAVSGHRTFDERAGRGQVDYMCDQIVNAVPQVLGGTIKAYAIATEERNPSLPNVPTTKEAGMPEFQASAWNALFAPKGTPKAMVDKLSDALDKALDDETTRKRLLELGSDIPGKDRRGGPALTSAGDVGDRQVVAGDQGGRPDQLSL